MISIMIKVEILEQFG